MAKDEEKKPATPYMGAKPGDTGTPAAKPMDAASEDAKQEPAVVAGDQAGDKIAAVRQAHPAQKVADQLRDAMLASLTDQTEQPERDVEPMTESRTPPEVTDDGVVVQEGGDNGGGGGGGAAGEAPGGAPAGGPPMAPGGGQQQPAGKPAPYMGVRRE